MRRYWSSLRRRTSTRNSIGTDELLPPLAGHGRDFLSVSVWHDFPPEVTSLPLIPARSLPFEFVQRAGVNRAAVRAFAPFAAAHFAASCTADMTSL